MEFLTCFLICTFALTATLAKESTTISNIVGDHDIDDVFPKKRQEERSQLRKSELAFKIMSLGELLLKQNKETGSPLTRRTSSAVYKTKPSGSLLKYIFGSDGYRGILSKLKRRVLSSAFKRSAHKGCRLRCRPSSPVCIVVCD